MNVYADGRARDPRNVDLDASYSRGRIRGYSKVDLVAIGYAGVADRANDIRSLPVHRHGKRRIDSGQERQGERKRLRRCRT